LAQVSKTRAPCTLREKEVSMKKQALYKCVHEII
jgi:hypothetical protein